MAGGMSHGPRLGSPLCPQYGRGEDARSRFTPPPNSRKRQAGEGYPKKGQKMHSPGGEDEMKTKPKHGFTLILDGIPDTYAGNPGSPL